MVARRYSYTLIIIVLLLIALIILRMQLPSIVKDYLNGKMADIGEYQGEIADVDIHLWRGAYSVDQLEITKKDQPEVVFFKAQTIDTSVSWAALLAGKVVADVDLMNAEIHLVDDETDDKPEEKSTWRQTVQEIIPLQIDRLNIDNGEIHFHNFTSDPPVHLVFYQLNGEITNLSNTDRNEGLEYANFDVEGRLFDNADATLSGRLDPLGDFHNFELKLKITGIDLTKLNQVSEAYGNFNFKSGNGDFVMELQADEAQLTGYAKPVMDNVEIFDLEKDLEEGVFSAAWQAIVGAFGQIFRNEPRDRIATQIEIRGNLDNPDTSAWQAFLAILQNAFVDAFESDFGRETNSDTSPSEVKTTEPESRNDSETETKAVNCQLQPMWEQCD
ncbi:MULTISPECIES: DUF748 domain-containing protein [unclassified Methylophaga]|jgi:hypothetical protein|uniref:DUF748 domain-containing protein n=1 Tax=unclassified Methylophaga TaxID=2629249 RepID=UPI000C8B4CC9|nr:MULTISPECIES: DUF748 domain-containing protein [unclassified Methylophaga]MAK66703.1 hypothetical protein [Methylophaga sp.]MAK68347.1 hypothetical protein [Methylophaga sp.]MAY17729.1 hypothetical protein [Methylophaga sp.]HAO25081.1 hypothetical protein [Methylophaga sp.]|tara:strand:- start:26419 stop:27579 length:1161 start_codon:yes stop_codon:yes gene_type:complete